MPVMTRIARSLVVPVVVTLTWPAVAGAQLTKAGVVTTLQGTATVARATAARPLPLRFKDDVFVQDRITTGDDSVARILLGGKAIVTVRERSVLTITEVPGTSTIELGIGKIALAVVKERMKSGETIEIRTPNAVAGIRGTVLITEVEQKTAQLGAGAAAFTSRFTVLQGIVAVSQYNPLTRQLGPTVNLGALQTTGITGSAAPRPPQTITPEAAKQLASEYKTTIKEAPPAANAGVANAQVQQAVNYVGAVVGPQGNPAPQAKVEQGQQRGSDASGGESSGTPTSTSSSGTSGSSTATSSSTSSGSGSGTSSGGQSSGKASGGPTVSTPAPVAAPTPTPPPVAAPTVVAAPIVAAPPVTPVVTAPVVVAPPVITPPPVIAPTVIPLPQVVSQPNTAIRLPSADDTKKHKLEESKNKKK